MHCIGCNQELRVEIYRIKTRFFICHNCGLQQRGSGRDKNE